MSEQTPMMMIQPSSLFKPITTLASTTIDTVQKIDKPEIKSSKSETISSIIESHESETKSEQKFHMKLEHKTPSIAETRTEMILKKETDVRDDAWPLMKMEERSMIENENIETSTIAKKDALSYFESITKESDVTPKGPKGMIKLTEDGQVQEAKVGDLMKSYERAATSYEVKKPEPRPSDFQMTKKTVQDIFTRLEQGLPRGVENKLFEFPYESPKLPPMEVKKTTLEKTMMASDLSMSQLQIQTGSTETMMKSFNLVPEPPPEICYMPKPEESKKKRPEIFVKAKQLQESFDKTLSPVEAPIGGVKIFPTPKAPEPQSTKVTTTPAFTIPPPFELEKKEAFEETLKKDTYEKRESKSFKEEKMEPWRYAPTSILSTSPIRPWSSSSDVETKSHVSTDLSEYRCHSAASNHQEIVRPTSPKPSADALAMEKSWAKKCADSNRKSWPPQVEAAQKREWNIPVDEYKSSTKEFKQEIEESPQGEIKKTSTESSASVEKRSWSSKEQFTEKISEGPPPASKLGPIIYNAETIKVDHTVNTMQEQSFFEKHMSELEKTHKSEELSSKRWTHGEELKAPSLVKKIEPPMKPLTTSHYVTESGTTSVFLEPGSPPEIGFIPPLVTKEQVVPEYIVKTKKEEPPVLPPKDVRITPPPIPSKKPVKISTPTPSKFIKSSFSHESDYESDFDGHPRAKWRPYESDNEEPHYRKVKAPVPKQPTRPRSTEPEPLPPSKFEAPVSQFAGPPRPLMVADSVEKTTKKTMFKRYEKESKQQQQIQQPSPITLKPGSPPIYVQPATKSPAPRSPPAKKPESPKFKTKIFQQDSGYMADTDEPFQQKIATTMTQKSFGKRDGSSMTIHTESHTSSTDSRTKFFESHSYKSDLRKEESVPVSSVIYSTPTTPKVVQEQRRFESVKVRGLLRVRVLFLFVMLAHEINPCGINREHR